MDPTYLELSTNVNLSSTESMKPFSTLRTPITRGLEKWKPQFFKWYITDNRTLGEVRDLFESVHGVNQSEESTHARQRLCRLWRKRWNRQVRMYIPELIMTVCRDRFQGKALEEQPMNEESTLPQYSPQGGGPWPRTEEQSWLRRTGIDFDHLLELEESTQPKAVLRSTISNNMDQAIHWDLTSSQELIDHIRRPPPRQAVSANALIGWLSDPGDPWSATIC
ncbi:hypothetical protein MMC24_006785 [Lignoscripta atroalba]|nr:hypothetical protein [Lignoscripta atroalba]